MRCPIRWNPLPGTTPRGPRLRGTPGCGRAGSPRGGRGRGTPRGPPSSRPLYSPQTASSNLQWGAVSLCNRCIDWWYEIEMIISYFIIQGFLLIHKGKWNLIFGIKTKILIKLSQENEISFPSAVPVSQSNDQGTNTAFDMKLCSTCAFSEAFCQMAGCPGAVAPVRAASVTASRRARHLEAGRHAEGVRHGSRGRSLSQGYRASQGPE